MDPLALIVRTVVAAVLAAAGVAKLKDLEGSRDAMRGFGMPPGLAPAAAVALPLVELAAAVCLTVPALAVTGAILAAALFAAMTAVMARLLLRGQAPSCHCFGRLQSEPIGVATLARTAVLLMAACVVALKGAGDSLGEIGPVGAEAAVPLACAGAAWALARRAARRPRLFPDSLPPGSTAPGFTLPRAGGGEGSLDALLSSGRPTALLFVEPGCGPCQSLLDELSEWQAPLANDLNLAILMKGARGRVEALHGFDDLMVDEEGSIGAAYGVHATPAAVLVGTDGRVARAPAAGREGIEALLRLALHEGASVDFVRQGK